MAPFVKVPLLVYNDEREAARDAKKSHSGFAHIQPGDLVMDGRNVGFLEGLARPNERQDARRYGAFRWPIGSPVRWRW